MAQIPMTIELDFIDLNAVGIKTNLGGVLETARATISTREETSWIIVCTSRGLFGAWELWNVNSAPALIARSGKGRNVEDYWIDPAVPVGNVRAGLCMMINALMREVSRRVVEKHNSIQKAVDTFGEKE